MNQGTGQSTKKPVWRKIIPACYRRRFYPFYAIMAVAVLCAAWSGLATMLAHRCDARLERDPDTGILEGAAPCTLGPEDADRAILFVHGFIGCPNHFETLPAQVAAQGWHVECMLLPGHGTTPFDFERRSAEELIEAVRERTRALQARYGTVVLLGHSMGGALVTKIAAEEHADALVLVAPYFGITRRWYYLLPPEVWTRLLSPVLRWGYRPAWALPVNRPEGREGIIAYRWVPLQGGLSAMEVCEAARKPEILQAVTCPVLLLHSRNDSVTSPAASKRVFEAMATANKRVVWFDDSDHVLFWDYDREAVARETVSFLQQLGADN